MSDDSERIELRGYPILFKNFRGEASEYNARGDRTFSVLIEDLDEAELHLSNGWKLKPLKDEDGEVVAYHIPAKIKLDGFKPGRAYQLRLEQEMNPVPLGSDTIHMLDGVDVDWVDVVITPYYWNVNGNTGKAAYVKVIFVHIDFEEIDDKYLNQFTA